MLEHWLGVTLVNRRVQRLELTRTAARFEPEIRRLMEQIYELRSLMRADALVQSRMTLTTQHTLMVTHLPKLLRFLRLQQQETAFHVRTGNLEECVAQLTRGEADLLLCFEAEGTVLPGQTADMARIEIGQERLLPVTACGPDGQPLFDMEGASPITLLSYPDESFLGRIVRRHCLPELTRHHTVETACESAFTVGLKEMALAGMGLAWLPQGLIERELDTGTLISMHEQLGSLPLSIVIYRLPGHRPATLDQLWSLIQQDGLQL